MSVAKIDRRIVYTKKALREALLDLLQVKTLNSISVSELCRHADINRNTFYCHYNAPLDLFREIEDELFIGMSQETQNSKDLGSLISAACAIAEANKRVSKIIFSDVENSHVLSRVIQSFRSEVDSKSGSQSNANETMNRYKDVFGEKGALYVLKEWVDDDFQEPAERVASFISRLLEEVKVSNTDFQKEIG